jgi:hypothetical protein
VLQGLTGSEKHGCVRADLGIAAASTGMGMHQSGIKYESYVHTEYADAAHIIPS